jgi:hypothetical protein
MLIVEDNEMNRGMLSRLTAHAMTGDREQALKAGCEGHDVRPVEFRRLLGKLEKLLGAVASKPSAGDRA